MPEPSDYCWNETEKQDQEFRDWLDLERYEHHGDIVSKAKQLYCAHGTVEPLLKPTCGNCRFFHEANYGEGDCQRHAPVVLDRSYHSGVYPKSNSYKWCGDHEPREKANA